MFRLTLVQLEGVKSTLYGGIFTVIMVLLRPVAQKHLYYIIANENNPKTEVSHNLSGVKNITQETRQLFDPLGTRSVQT